LRLISGCLASLSALFLGGCLYGFAGGGLPPSIKTVAVLPFDNQTPEPTLTQEISRAVRDAVERQLGLRQADSLLPGGTPSFKITRGGHPNRITIQTEYNEEVDLPLFKYTFVFHPRAEEPL
jgi:hypothetical protein